MDQQHGGILPVSLRERLARRAVELFGLLRTAWEAYERDYARFFAGAMVYYALVSLIPLLLLLVAGLGLALRFTELAADAQQQLLRSVEVGFGAQVRETVEQLLGALQQESVVATLVSLVGLLLTASALFGQLRQSFRAIWKVAPASMSGVRGMMRASILEQAIAFAIVLLGGALLLVGLILIAAAQWLTAQVSGVPLLSFTGGWLLGLLSPLALATLTFLLLFRYLPPRRLGWRSVWLAALLCAVAWVVVGEILALYGALFGGSASGAIGGLLAVMLWMNAVSQIFFFGAELCKVVATGAARTTA